LPPAIAEEIMDDSVDLPQVWEPSALRVRHYGTICYASEGLAFVNDTFNPYFEWFGIAGAESRPNHYALLGLKPFESDPSAITAACQQRISVLKKASAGAHEALRRQVFEELATAKRTLCDPALKQRYDERLRQHVQNRRLGKSAVRSSSATVAQTTQKPAGVNLLPPTRVAPSEANESNGFLECEDSDDLLPPTTGEAAMVGRPAGAHHAASAHVVSAGEPGIMQTSAAAAEPGDALTGVVSSRLATARTAARQLASRRQKSQRFAVAASLLLLSAAGAALGVGYATGYIRIGRANGDAAELASNGNVPPAETTKSTTSNGESDRASADANMTSVSSDAHEQADSNRRPPAMTETEPQKVVDSSSPSPEKPTEAEPAKPSPMPDAAQITKFRGVLSAARTAMGERKFEEADRHIAEATKLAATEEQQRFVAAMEAVRSDVDEFWKAVEEGHKGLEEAGELQVGSTIVSVVEANADQLVIRLNGQNRRYKRDQLPAGLAVAIAKKWFDDRPENKEILGAFYFVDPRMEVAEAKRLWEEAAAGGVDVKDLLGLLPVVAGPSATKQP
jgi:hypothetical protein